MSIREMSIREMSIREMSIREMSIREMSIREMSIRDLGPPRPPFDLTRRLGYDGREAIDDIKRLERTGKTLDIEGPGASPGVRG